MGTCVIFCAGEFDALAQPIEDTDYILAADGGLRHVQRLKLTPDGVLGDFDSLGYVPADAKVFPVEKDDTDAMLAVRQGLKQGYKQFVIYGGLDGSRLDHTVANFQTLQFLADHGARGYLVGKEYIVTVLREETAAFSESCEGVLSLFCLGPEATGITLENLKYPLTNGSLSSGFPLGVSNHFIGKAASVCVGQGSLLAMWDRINGFPEERIP